MESPKRRPHKSAQEKFLSICPTKFLKMNGGHLHCILGFRRMCNFKTVVKMLALSLVLVLLWKSQASFHALQINHSVVDQTWYLVFPFYTLLNMCIDSKDTLCLRLIVKQWIWSECEVILLSLPCAVDDLPISFFLRTVLSKTFFPSLSWRYMRQDRCLFFFSRQ